MKSFLVTLVAFSFWFTAASADCTQAGGRENDQEAKVIRIIECFAESVDLEVTIEPKTPPVTQFVPFETRSSSGGHARIEAFPEQIEEIFGDTVLNWPITNIGVYGLPTTSSNDDPSLIIEENTAMISSIGKIIEANPNSVSAVLDLLQSDPAMYEMTRFVFEKNGNSSDKNCICVPRRGGRPGDTPRAPKSEVPTLLFDIQPPQNFQMSPQQNR